LLALDAASAAGSVALFIDESRVDVRAVRMGASTEDHLLPAIDELCRAAGIAPRAIRSVVCGEGPGSFTSLRIAASIAKGIAHANGAALFAMPSLLLAAASIAQRGEYLVHSDAMRGERFVQHVEITSEGSVVARGDVFRMTMADVPSALPHELQSLPLVAVASDASNTSSTVVIPDASRALRLPAWQSGGNVDLRSWEPSYGRLAEAQVKWESVHGSPLPTGAA
jgi:tRNA threonylcarbamoyladenosine biosynthesis protein TsaB